MLNNKKIRILTPTIDVFIETLKVLDSYNNQYKFGNCKTCIEKNYNLLDTYIKGIINFYKVIKINEYLDKPNDVYISNIISPDSISLKEFKVLINFSENTKKVKDIIEYLDKNL